MKFLSKLTFDQKIIACLTAIIAVAAIVQSASAIYQTNLFVESEARNRQREQPNVKIFPRVEPFVETHSDGEVPKSYIGFDIVNRSPFEVTIERIGLTKAWPIDQDLDAAKSIQLPYLTKNDVSDMSDVLLPKRLSYGEILEVRFEKDRLIEELNKWKGKTPLPVRPFCIDSLWNMHYDPDLWITWTQSSTVVGIDPGPNFEHIEDFYVW